MQNLRLIGTHDRSSFLIGVAGDFECNTEFMRLAHGRFPVNVVLLRHGNVIGFGFAFI